jgi:hypothetical protein
MQAWMSIGSLQRADSEYRQLNAVPLDEVEAWNSITVPSAGPISIKFYATQGTYRIGDLIKVTISDSENL